MSERRPASAQPAPHHLRQTTWDCSSGFRRSSTPPSPAPSLSGSTSVRRSRRSWGSLREEWCADPDRWLSRLHPEDRDRVVASEAADVAGKAPWGAAEYRLFHRDGHVVWVRDDALLLTGSDGTRLWHGVMSDISQQKQAESELERRAAQQAAVARLGEHALEGMSTSDLMQEATAAATALLELEMGAVLELMPGNGSLRGPRVLRSARHGGRRRPAGRRAVPGGLHDPHGRCRDRQRWAARPALQPLCGDDPGQSEERADGGDRGSPRAVRRARRVLHLGPRIHRRAMSTSSRPWPTCWVTPSSGR